MELTQNNRSRLVSSTGAEPALRTVPVRQLSTGTLTVLARRTVQTRRRASRHRIRVVSALWAGELGVKASAGRAVVTHGAGEVVGVGCVLRTVVTHRTSVTH